MAFPDVPKGTPLHALLVELHLLHARAGRPSLDEMVRAQARDPKGRFGRDAIHRLFSDCREAPKLPLLFEVVRILAALAPGADVEEQWERFDQLWMTVERYEALSLGQGFLYDGIGADDGSGDLDG
ncbi:hypothetical protein [Nocardia fluminea]|uniref:hypothetical protein n=1 Tax=Nocardia fluminea TaxID=134984 RepID=UPI003D0B7AFE